MRSITWPKWPHKPSMLATLWCLLAHTQTWHGKIGNRWLLICECGNEWEWSK